MRPIILDCDPGLDDALAILLAAGSPDVELLAVTTVGGNQTLDLVTRNALRLKALAGFDAPVAAGADRPLVEPLRAAAGIHGDDGLGDSGLPDAPELLDPRHAVDLIVDTVMSRPTGDVTLVPVGPLTNIALAVRKEPRIVGRVREVVLMGGCYGPGNASPVAEFNILCDPEAADVVFSAGWPVTMHGLDLTHQALAGQSVRDRVTALGTPVAQAVTDMLVYYRDAYIAARGMDAPPLHDPCAVAYVISPDLFETRVAPVRVELAGTRTRGMTVCDLRLEAPQDGNVRVATRIDADGFWDLVLDALERLGR